MKEGRKSEYPEKTPDLACFHKITNKSHFPVQASFIDFVSHIQIRLLSTTASLA